jgi:ribosome-binding protein aMBF1 (putative translation factor)
MLVHTKKRHTDEETVSLCFQVRPENVEKIRAFVAKLEPATAQTSSVSADEYFVSNFPHETRSSVHLKGLRYREGLTQVQLAAKTGIRQNHLSEMESGKRPIGKENAKKLAAVLDTDYRLFL